MPSADNISDLILYTFIAIIVLVVLTVIIRISPWGKRIRQSDQNWQISQTVAPPPTSSQTRIKYVDPVDGAKIKYALGVFVAAIVLAFVYYFITRGGVYPGN